jgi:hypothetical protein
LASGWNSSSPSREIVGVEVRPRREGTPRQIRLERAGRRMQQEEGEADKKTRWKIPVECQSSRNDSESWRSIPPWIWTDPLFILRQFAFLSSRLGASSNSFLSVIGLRGLPVPWIPTEWWRGKVQMAHGFLLTQSGGSQLTSCCSGSGRDGTEEGMNG